MNVEAAGALSIGAVVGYVLRYFMRRFKTFTPKGLVTVLGALGGGALFKFLAKSPGAPWWYFIGILAGFVAYTLIALARGDKDVTLR